MERMICLGERLKEARKRAGYTQERLAETVGVSRAAIARFETGEIEPSLKTFVLLADALHISTDTLLGREKKEAGAAESLTHEAAAALEDFLRIVKKDAEQPSVRKKTHEEELL